MFTSLPYCEAVIQEALRLFMAHTFGIPHRALRDTKLCGYDIPKVRKWTPLKEYVTYCEHYAYPHTKDSMVIGCFAGMMLNVSIFDDPLSFRPDRFFLDGKIVVPEQYHPFGVGKHRCMGEIMARSNLFLFITTLLQNFTFTVPPGQQMPSPEPLDGATPSVCQYTALITAR